jgi:hypothetical protein
MWTNNYTHIIKIVDKGIEKYLSIDKNGTFYFAVDRHAAMEFDYVDELQAWAKLAKLTAFIIDRYYDNEIDQKTNKCLKSA